MSGQERIEGQVWRLRTVSDAGEIGGRNTKKRPLDFVVKMLVTFESKFKGVLKCNIWGMNGK